MTEQKKDNGLNNLLINIVVPSLILMKGKKFLPLDSTQILLLALAFPLCYGLYDLFVKKEKNFVSILGFVSILLSGIVGVLELSTELIAIKEAAVPFIIGCVILISNFTKKPLAPKFLYHDEIFNKKNINEKLDDQGHAQIDSILKKASIFLFLSFIFSAVMNFALAKYFVQSDAGTEAFNEELGQMTLYSYPIIVIPSIVIMVLIMRYIYISIKKLTGLTSKTILTFQQEEA